MILSSGVRGLAAAFPSVERVIGEMAFEDAVAACVGLDGRQIRKVVLAACGVNKQLALEPQRMTANDLLCAVESFKAQALQLKENRK